MKKLRKKHKSEAKLKQIALEKQMYHIARQDVLTAMKVEDISTKALKNVDKAVAKAANKLVEKFHEDYRRRVLDELHDIPDEQLASQFP